MEMDIGIIGSGHIGSTLARHLAALGHQVSIANSRGPDSLATVAAADTGAAAATVEQAAHARDMVIIGVPEKSVWQLPRGVLRLIDALGFDGMDAGTLADSWRQQPGTPAYCRDLDIKGLKAALAKADAAQVATYRAQADEAARASLVGKQ
jgi:predicted dinucleotide-binding enzyme